MLLLPSVSVPSFSCFLLLHSLLELPYRLFYSVLGDGEYWIWPLTTLFWGLHVSCTIYKLLSPKLACTWILLGIAYVQMHFCIHFLSDHLQVIKLQHVPKNAIAIAGNWTVLNNILISKSLFSRDSYLSTYKKKTTYMILWCTSFTISI